MVHNVSIPEHERACSAPNGISTRWIHSKELMLHLSRFMSHLRVKCGYLPKNEGRSIIHTNMLHHARGYCMPMVNVFISHVTLARTRKHVIVAWCPWVIQVHGYVLHPWMWAIHGYHAYSISPGNAIYLTGDIRVFRFRRIKVCYLTVQATLACLVIRSIR